MPTKLPLLPVTVVGSWPRPQALLSAQRDRRAGRIGAEELRKLEDAAVLEALRLQERSGVDIVSDGEQRRDNFYSFVSDKLEGVRMMTLAEMLSVVEDKAAFERILATLDVPAFSISNPTCVGKVKRRSPLALDELTFLKKHTDRAIKVPLPGPYILTRAMFVPEVALAHYPSKEALADDVVKILRDEIGELVKAGADFIQLDEPVLTELVFTQGETRTFMCAALSATKDPTAELELAVSLVNRVIEGFDSTRIGVHVCRGNWSKNESTLLRGGYSPLAPWLDRMHVRQLVLEYATERAGELVRFAGKELGLGVVNPRTDRVETKDELVARIKAALDLYPADKLFLNPDCGFGTFSSRPLASAEVAAAKLASIAAAARTFRS